MPNSPPATPAMTLSFTTSGATVIAYPALAFATLVFQMGRPVFASSATRCASRVARNSVSPRIARPRLTDPQHGLAILGDTLFLATLDARSEEHTSELQSRPHLVCRLLLA